MIIYDNRDILLIIGRRSGSVLLSRMVLLPAFISTVICGVLLYLASEGHIVKMSSSVARIYSTILGFVIVFRTSMAFGRFFEGISHVQMFFSKWRDAFSSLASFCECSIMIHAERGNRESVEQLMMVKARFLHWFSMLSAFAVQELQNDDKMTECDESLGLGQDMNTNRLAMIQVPANRLAPISEESRMRKRRSSGMGQMLMSSGEKGMEVHDTDPFASNMIFLPMPGADPLSSAGFADDEGQGGGRGGIRSSIGMASFSSNSACEGTAEQRRRAICVIGEITMQEFHQLSMADDHVLTVIKWIIMEVSHHIVSGQLLIGAPILSRVYQELSNGMLAFSLAKIKISTVPFPFPFAQVLSYALYAFYVLCPFVILEVLDEAGENGLQRVSIPLLLNFLVCVGYGACNEIAIELEEPFGFDANDYPVHGQQTMIVRSMEDTYFASAPGDFSMASFSGGPSVRFSQDVQQHPPPRSPRSPPLEQEFSPSPPVPASPEPSEERSQVSA